MLNISRESEVNIVNTLIDHDVISGTDLIKIKKASNDGEKSQIETIFELELANEQQILDILIKEQALEVVDLSTESPTDELKKILPSNYITMNFIAPFKIDGNTLHIAISDSSKLSLMRNLKTITKKDIELHGSKVSHISTFIEQLLSDGETTVQSIVEAKKDNLDELLVFIAAKVL